MTKIKRSYSNSKIYHTIIKGIDNQDIFYEEQDKIVFLKKMLITKKEYDNNIYAYCLMDNHVHIVLKSEKEFLSKAMQTLMIRYVRYFNKKYKRTGTLVQNRFKSKKVENQRYFLEVCRYVHRNPENAGIAKTEDYKWSSYHEYLGKPKLIDKNTLLHYYDNNINNFVENTTQNNMYDDLNELAEYEMIGRLTDGQLASIIVQKFNIDDVSEIANFFKSRTKEEIREDIQMIKKIKGINRTQLARVIRCNRYTIEKNW